jgi:hypothetical protein
MARQPKREFLSYLYLNSQTVLFHVTERTSLDRLIGKHFGIMLPKPLSSDVNNQCRSSGEPKTWSGGVCEIWGNYAHYTTEFPGSSIRMQVVGLLFTEWWRASLTGNDQHLERFNIIRPSRSLLEDCEWRFQMLDSNFQNGWLQFFEIRIARQMALMGYYRYFPIWCQ